MKVFISKKLNSILIKYNILILSMLPSPFLYAQIAFEGESATISVLNSAADENFLFLNNTGSRLFFSRLKSPVNSGGSSNPGNIWQSSFDSTWSSPEMLEGDSLTLQSPLGWMQSGLIYGEVTEKYNAFTSEIYDSRKGILNIPYFQNKSQHLSGFISRDGKYLLLSIERSTTYGVEDIYVCQKLGDDGWSSPKNLGADINTPFQEYTPFLAADSKRLFWASNGRSGAGSFDIFYSERLDDSWQNWTQPKNLGQAINTEGAETSFQLAGDYAYFVSTQNSDGYGDIRRIRLRQPEPVVEVLEDSIQEEILKTAEFLLKDAETGNTIAGNIKIDGIGIDTTLTNRSSLVIEKSRLKDFKITAEATGYISVEKIFTESELTERSQFNLELVPLAIGTTVQLKNVLFQRGTTNFIGGSERELDRVVEMLQAHPKLKILVKGHTDSQGDPSLNLKLSQQRAKKVRDYILSKNIPSSRVQGKGYGGNAPIASNATEDSRKLNRRVEFTVLEK